MTERELVKQTADLLRTIIRSVDKKLDYGLIDQNQEGRFVLRLTTRGREGIVTLRTDDLRAATESAVSKNAIRQKIKSKRDRLLSDYVVDVMGTNLAKLLKPTAKNDADVKSSFFRRAPTGRRR